MVRRLIYTAILAAAATNAQSPFQTKMPADDRIAHALNRLTFGPRPGEVNEVRRIGLEKWLGMQLHPESITENPVLDARLKPLETLRMDTATIQKEYPLNFFRPPMRPNPNEILPGGEYPRLMRSRPEEQKAILAKLDAEKRRIIMSSVPQNAFSGAPELEKEAADARAADQAERQKEFRKMMPPLQDLLNPEQMSTAMQGNPEQLKQLFAYLDPMKRRQVAGALPPQALAAYPELRREGMRLRQPQQVLLNDVREGKVFRAVYSNRQLEEVLVDFWFNHFNVFEGKQNERPLLASFERDAIRPHVLGHFKDLLLATARHPAMLYYLDNFESTSSDIFSIGPFADPIQSIANNLARRAHGINENYGRELMELHTLGVKGGYTQDDVIAVARCFTGWTVRDPGAKPEFVFAGFMHDNGEKTVLGHKIAAGGGERDGLQVIDILAHHPSTAKFLSRELAQRFVADDPPQSLIDRMAQTFTKTDGDLRAVMETMFSSPEFFSEGASQAKIKSPLEMVVSAVRASGADVTDTWALVQRIDNLGEPLYGKVEPTGYPNTAEGWLSTANLFGRINFAATLMSGQVAGVKPDLAPFEGKDASAVAHAILGRQPSAAVLDAIHKGYESKEPSPPFIAGLVMGSPDFQKR